LCEWIARSFTGIFTGDRSSIFKDQDRAIYHPPDPEYHELRTLQRPEKFMADLKIVYTASDETAALQELNGYSCFRKL